MTRRLRVERRDEDHGGKEHADAVNVLPCPYNQSCYSRKRTMVLSATTSLSDLTRAASETRRLSFRFLSCSTASICGEGLVMAGVRVTTCVAIGTLPVSGMAGAQNQERRIKRSELPPAIEKAVVAQGQGSTICGFSQERGNGKTFYEAELIVNHHSKDVLMDEGGKVVEGRESDQER